MESDHKGSDAVQMNCDYSSRDGRESDYRLTNGDKMVRSSEKEKRVHMIAEHREEIWIVTTTLGMEDCD